MSTAEEPVANFYPMPDHAAMAVLADRCDRLNRALEAVKRVPRPGGNQFKALVVVIAAHFAFGHNCSVRSLKQRDVSWWQIVA